MAEEGEEKAKKGGLLLRAKKNVGGKLAMQSKKVLPQEVKSLLKGLRKIVEIESGKKKADEVEKNIMKLLVKMVIHVENKSINLDEFLKADRPLRAAFEIIYDCFDYYNDMESERTKKTLRVQFEKMEKLLKEAEQILHDILKKHLQPKSLDRLHSVFDHIATANFFCKVWETPDLYEDLFQLVNAMNKYTQFHFY